MRSRSSIVMRAVTIAVLLAGSFGCAPNPIEEVSLATPTIEELSVAAPTYVAPVPITISSDMPSDLNLDSDDASNNALLQAAAFAWQEFVMLNWPAVPQNGELNNRDMPDISQKFGDPTYTGPLVWHTFRSKVEIYPGQGNPNGYVDDPTQSYGYDCPPVYTYGSSVGMNGDGQVPPFSSPTPGPTPTPGPITACPTPPLGPITPWINLDENSEIGLTTMYAGVAQSTSEGGQILFLAKANRAEYTYVAKNNYWSGGASTSGPISNTKTYVATNKKSPLPEAEGYVSFPSGTIEVKSAWRQLTPEESTSGRFYQTLVRYYRSTSSGGYGYVDEVWGMVALHIIHKTLSSPYFIYATFSQADNLLDVHGKPIEDVDGKLIENHAATPLDPNIVSQNATGNSPQVLMPSMSSLSLADIGSRLYYQNATSSPLPQGSIALNKREHDISETIIAVNQEAHMAIASYNQANGLTTSPWMYYKLVSVQYQPYDKPPGITYTGAPGGPDPFTYYQANEVVESDYNLQVFSGRFSADQYSITDYNTDGTGFQNVYFNGSGYLMGGCMGCHGNAQVAGTDFSFIFQGGPVAKPDTVGDVADLAKFLKLFFGK